MLSLPATPARPAPPSSPPASRTPPAREYRGRRPADTVLFDAVRAHLPAFRAFARERSGLELPKYVVREFERYLACGDLSQGFLLARCDACDHAFVVGFSCKARGLCPSCSTRRMHGTAATLVDRVLPDVPYRQWVLTLPRWLRLPVARDAKVLSAMHRIFVTEVERAYLNTTALDAHGRGDERRCGSVTFVQRFSSNLGLHCHFHLLAPDGVFVRACDASEDTVPEFVAAPRPSDAVLAQTVGRVHDRAMRWLRRRGLLDETPVEDRANELATETPMDSVLRVASAQGSFATLLDPQGARGASAAAGGHDADRDEDERGVARLARRTKQCGAAYEGFDLHAGVAVAAGHRVFLERLCRYGARPAFALDRLSRLPDGRYSYRLKYPMYGQSHRVLEPMDLLARLAAIVPPPRYPLTRFAGVFASASPWRALVVPPHPATRRCCATHERERKTVRALGEQNAVARGAPSHTACVPPRHEHDPVIGRDTAPVETATLATPWSAATAPRFDVPSVNSTRVPWRDLLLHGLEVDALQCRCGGRMRIVAAVLDPAEAQRILAHLRARGGTDAGAAENGAVPSRAWDPVPIDTTGDCGEFDAVDAVYDDDV